MPSDHLFRVLGEITPLSPEFKQALEREIVPLSLPEHHLLLEPPHVAGQVFFLDEGFAMSYTFFRRRTQIERFWKKGDVIISMRSFFEQVPSAAFIELMAPGKVLCISYTSLMSLLHRFPEALYLLGVIMSRCCEHCRARVHDLQHEPARVRYEKLTRNFPGIERIISQELIAAYIGIAPQSLSRMKKQRKRK